MLFRITWWGGCGNVKVKPTSSRLENMIMAEVYQTKFLMLFFLGHFARIIKFPPEYRIHSIMNKTREMTQTKCTRWLILMCILNTEDTFLSLCLARLKRPTALHQDQGLLKSISYSSIMMIWIFLNQGWALGHGREKKPSSVHNVLFGQYDVVFWL